MKASIIIDNYNYGKFITECVNSVLQQTYKNIEIVIIDDGSTDNSLELINEKYSKNHLVDIVSKKNGGQLSTFNEAIKHITGDIIFFLDSDDMYKNDYIEKALEIYKKNKDIDFVFCAMEKFFSDGRKEIVQRYKENTDIGFSMVSAIHSKEWIGNVTSTLSMKKDILNQILPIPFEKDWANRADDCLIWGSSVVGAKKYYFNESLVLYRAHGANTFYGKEFSNVYLYKREISINRLFSFFINKFDLNDKILNFISLEFKSRYPKDYKLLKRYMKIVFNSKEAIILKIIKIIHLIKIYYRK